VRVIRQWWCGFFGGHDDMRHWGEGRVWLQCTACGRTTPGLTAGCSRTRVA